MGIEGRRAVNPAAAAAEERDGLATTRSSIPEAPEPVEVISPELALVDPELAERARALLPTYGEAVDLLDDDPVVSPELVLVDPVLAEWARARLPDRPLAELHAAPAPVAAVEEAAELPPSERVELVVPDAPAVAGAAEEAAELPAPEDVQPVVAGSPTYAYSEWTPELLWQAAEERNLEERAVALRRRQRTRGLVLGVVRAASLAAAAAVIAAAGFLAGASVSRRGSPGPAVFNRSAQTAASVPRVASGGTTAGHSTSAATATTSVLTRRPLPTTHQRPLQTRPQPRTFLWAPVAGAAYYEVAFYRAGRRVFLRRTKGARLSLPSRWTYGGRRMRLVPGVYRWYVWPIYTSAAGRRRGSAVVQSVLTVPAR